MWFEGPLLLVDPLAITAALCITFFTVLTLVYSVGYRLEQGRTRYYVYILLTFGAALGTVLTGNLIVLLVCWGVTGVLLYLLIGYGTKERTPATAKKALIIVGGTDAFMMLGVVLVFQLSGSANIVDIRISMDDPVALYAFLCLLTGALAKSGAVPLHTWIPDTAEDAPASVTAFLPASVDKLLGIYLLARMVLDLFVLSPAMLTLLFAIGAVTIAGAGMMMLVQRDFRRLLGYCAVSQVGYILLGIASGHPLGIAGGLFHMVNHAVYKSCLFFCGGVVEQQTHSADIERLGGMAGRMPVVFVTFLVAALSVSGVPPLNGFVSKWMVYQGIIEVGRSGGTAWVLWLVVAMFGSALTLAGMMKLVHAIFLGQPAAERDNDDVPVARNPSSMLIPPIVLASLCVVFGIWAGALPLKYLVLPILDQAPDFDGVWHPTLATVLILAGIGFGLLLYMGNRLTGTMRRTEAFIGGESLDAVPGMRVSGGAFFDTVRGLPGFRWSYRLAENRTLDLYEIGGGLTLGMHRVLRRLHNGILSFYLAWLLFGTGVLFYILLYR